MASRPIRTSLPIGETRLHQFQVVRERRDDGSHEDWVIVDFSGDDVDLATLDFDWHRTVPASAFENGTFEPLRAGDLPVWGY